MVRFWCVGDWGEQSSPQKRLASTILDVDNLKKNTETSSTILALGDNFYMNGVLSISDDLWKRVWWEGLQERLQKKWVACLGNHDFHLDPDAQILFTYTYPESRWYMPARYYVYTEKKEGLTVHVLVLDTVSLCPETSMRFRHVRGEFLHPPDSQWTWIRSTLQSIKDKNEPVMIMMMGHYPIFSLGPHGDTFELYPLWELMKQYHVSAYLFGHEHSSTLEMKDGILMVGSSAISFSSLSSFPEVALSSDVLTYLFSPEHSVWSLDIHVDKSSTNSKGFHVETNLWSLENISYTPPRLIFSYRFKFPIV